jgi:hypothetical protein
MRKICYDCELISVIFIDYTDNFTFLSSGFEEKLWSPFQGRQRHTICPIKLYREKDGLWEAERKKRKLWSLLDEKYLG